MVLIFYRLSDPKSARNMHVPVTQKAKKYPHPYHTINQLFSYFVSVILTWLRRSSCVNVLRKLSSLSSCFLCLPISFQDINNFCLHFLEMNPFLPANLQAPCAISLVKESGSSWNCCYRISLVWWWQWKKGWTLPSPSKKLCKWGDVAGKRICILNDYIAKSVYFKVKQKKALPGWDPEVYVGSQFISHL